MEQRRKMSRRKRLARIRAINNMKKRVWISILSSLIMISMFTGSTYAWFTSTALTSGNKMKTGIMAIDLLMEKTELEGKIESSDALSNYTKYIREIEEKEYYVITDEDVALITFENAEPGQIYKVDINIANTGQLALSYTPSFAIQIDESDSNNPKAMSYTGLETLQNEIDETMKYLKENYPSEFTSDDIPSKVYGYDEDLAENGYLTIRDYEIRKRVLDREQKNSDGIDIGGHLEDVLKVYVADTPDEINDGSYVGTIKEVINGTADLKYTGYLLPYSALINDGGSFSPKNVEIFDSDGVNKLRDLTGVSEFGKLSFYIKLPEDTNNFYQYASLTLRVGAKATQVEYEEDGLGIKIYDKEADIKRTVSFDLKGHGEPISSIKVDLGYPAYKPDDPSENGFVFEGWFKEEDLVNEWDFEKDVVKEDMTLYAKWESLPSE